MCTTTTYVLPYTSVFSTSVLYYVIQRCTETIGREGGKSAICLTAMAAARSFPNVKFHLNNNVNRIRVDKESRHFRLVSLLITM